MQTFPKLSNREVEVIQLLLKGKSNKLMALDMQVTERTIEFHLKNIYAKFQVNSRMELVLRLKDDTTWPESKTLGNSTVARKGNFAENGDGLNYSNWVTSTKEAVSKFGKEIGVKMSSVSDNDNGSNPITFQEAILKCLTKYAEFNGRASRAEFWWFALFVGISTSAFTLVHETAGSIFLLAVLLPFLAAGARRLRDSGKSVWWLLFLLAPVGGIVILSVLWVLPTSDTFSEKSTLSS